MNLDMDDLRDEQKRIADIIGIESYLKLSNALGGTTVYIAKVSEIVERKNRDERIRREFTGWNYKELALKYGLTETWIRNIVSPIEKQIRTQPMNGQVSVEELLGVN